MNDRRPVVGTVSGIFFSEHRSPAIGPLARPQPAMRIDPSHDFTGPVDAQRRESVSQLGLSVEIALRESPYREMRRVLVDVSAENRGVRLRGCVSSYFLKQLAQEIVRRIAPGQPIHNGLHVTRHSR